VRIALEQLPVPVVLDADGLWELEPSSASRPPSAPASGELARLVGPRPTTSRTGSVGAASGVEVRATVLLKGAGTLVASHEGVLVSGYGAPSLATAGTGDVLSGVIGAFLAKGLEARLAAGAGAVLHGIASRLVSPQAGLVAGDLLPALQRALEGEGSDLAPLG
jgi:NAD(P)H-hydrate epimerase